MEPGLREVLKEQADSVSFAYHHHPLEGIHPHAFNAAIAYECATDQGRARQMHDVLYDHQDELASEPWKEMASLAGVPDSARYSACLSSSGAAERVRADAALARDLDLLGTPTIVIGQRETFGAIGPDSLRVLLRKERSR
jgi:protein-disulfide isomerase